MMREPRIPISTYRVQLHAGFTFRDAAAIVPYLSALGVSACYVSPPFTAGVGSTHGYDVGSHNEISPELGGEVEYRRFAEVLERHSMGLILDFVPNHMGNDPQTNEWWRDVLENGPSSPYAQYFDIDWDPVKAELKDRLLLPILGEQYGEALESGKLRLEFDEGMLVLDYQGRRLPINPRRAPAVYESEIATLTSSLGDDHPHLREFLSVLTALRNLPPYVARDPKRIVERQREKEVARERMVRLVAESEVIGDYVRRVVASFNGVPGDPRSFDRLHELLEQQAYRLASWRTASDEINYRRFFDINELAGLRVEDPEVFDGIHRLVLQLVADGRATGLRLDHIDGLLDPEAYLARLRAAIGRVAQGAHPFYVVVEKILSSGEMLPRQWAAAGTTGYNFLNDLNGIFIDGRHARSLMRTYRRLTSRDEPLADVEYESKRLIIGTALSSEVHVLTAAINRLSERDRRFRDFTFGNIRRALREVVACFPVYRTYVAASGVAAADRAAVDAAIAMARLRNPALESSIFEFLRTVLLPEPASSSERNTLPYDQRLELAMKVQQVTAPVQAKGVEDTAFYRYNLLLSLNEVGGDPGRFGRSVSSFHRANAHRRVHWPHEMIATATHDTKRGEDSRARLNVLSEVPSRWRDAASAWMRMNRRLRTTVDGQPAPDRNDEYHFYQAFLAIWPPELDGTPVPERAPADLMERLRDYMRKAIRESKLHTSWINPNEAYEQAMDAFVERVLRGDGAAAFLAEAVPFARRLARDGVVNSMAQLTLKMVSPGVPDFYQGTELWDLSLVDPDNRRPVDYESRRAMLAALEPLLPADPSEVGEPARAPDLAPLVSAWPDGRLKLFVTTAGLRLRRSRPDLFLHGAYVPLVADGLHREHVVACAREHGADVVVAIVPRLLASVGITQEMAEDRDRWRDTRVRLPDRWGEWAWRSVLTGAPVKPMRTGREAWLMASQALDVLPVALLLGRGPITPAEATPSGS
jgi:(1->4)-alpha-D-glucan 1-alpha-D-glucosylmutase